jgi:hypothetical protein
MNFTTKKISELIEFLQGGCDTLDEGVVAVLGDEYDATDLSIPNLTQIDQDIFLCDTCGWWFEICEESENCGDE